MATYDQLTPEQRAIIELILKQGQGYNALGDMLATPTSRVRELARDALVRLSPVSALAVEDDWRPQVADYLLGQQGGPEATATRGHLRHSEAARGWSRSVLDSLDQFYEPGSLPLIPDAEPAASNGATAFSPSPSPPTPPTAAAKPAQPEPKAPTHPRKRLSPRAQAIVRRRRIALGGALGAVVLLLFVLLVWPVGLLGGDDGTAGTRAGTGGSGQPVDASAKPKILGQLGLSPIESIRGSTKYAGIAAIADQDGSLQLVVRAQLPANEKNQAYQVWLYNSDGEVRSIGAQRTNEQGVFQGAGKLPADYKKFTYIDVSREPLDVDTDKHSGDSVLRGRVDGFAPADDG